MGFYGRHVLPHAIDFACGMTAVAAQRAKIIPMAKGRVLEVGVGSGLNLPFYDTARVTELVGLDPSPEILRLARKKAHSSGLPVQLIAASAELIPLKASSFDTVVVTYTLCSVAEPEAVLSELHRVLKPGGRMLFAEHGRAPDPNIRRWQDRLNPIWKRVAGGCQLSRDPRALLSAAGFAIDQLETGYLKGPKPMTFNMLVRPQLVELCWSPSTFFLGLSNLLGGRGDRAGSAHLRRAPCRFRRLFERGCDDRLSAAA